MSNWGRRIYDFVIRVFVPCPTLFDLCACLGVIGIAFLPRHLWGFYFVFYSLFITVIGFHSACRRNISMPEFTMLSLIGLIGLFIHSFIYGPKSITFQYLNFYLMFEGFIYIFFGCAMFYVLVSKGKNLRLFFVTLPIALISFFKFSIHSGRGSIIFAMAIASIIYLIMRKKYGWSLVIALFSIDLFIYKFAWFKMKFACRIPLWKDMFLDLWQHPFIGTGFNKLLIPDNMMISTSWGKTWLFKHNDYLNIVGVLGVFAIIPVLIFIRRIILQTKNSLYLIPVIGIAILCFVQMTIFSGDMALVIVCFLSLAYIENERGNTWI